MLEELAYCVPLGLPHEEFLEWPEDSQDKALAYMRMKRSTCPDCGTRMEEWEEDRFAYVSDSWQCPGCELLTMEDSNVPDDAKGVHKRLVPNPNR